MRRAYERNDAAIARWLRQEFPAIARQAKREKTVIHWGYEMGLRSDYVTETSYSLSGQTPLVRASRKFGSRLFVRFMQRALKRAPDRVYHIVDGHPVHRSVVAK